MTKDTDCGKGAELFGSDIQKMITRADTIDTFNKAVSKVERTEFQSIPPDRPPPAEVALNQELEQALSLEVENLVKKVAIAQTTASDGPSARSLLFPRKTEAGTP